MHEYFDDAKYFYLVLDLCTGDELQSWLSEMGTLDEFTAAKLFRQMVQAVAHCIGRGFVNRDLTPKSFMFLSADPGSPLLLVDLGLSRAIQSGLSPFADYGS